jgi:hypothetical protein
MHPATGYELATAQITAHHCPAHRNRRGPAPSPLRHNRKDAHRCEILCRLPT